MKVFSSDFAKIIFFSAFSAFFTKYDAGFARKILILFGMKKVVSQPV